MTEFKPIPDPAGALEPPRRFPPTAVGAATPEPEPEREHVPVRSRRARPRTTALEAVLQLALGLPLLGLEFGERAVRWLAHRAHHV